MPPTPAVTFADWRAQVDKELAGASFDKLVYTTAEGLAIQPLYVDGPAAAAGVRGGAERVGVCMRARNVDEAREELDGGADALLIELTDHASWTLAQQRSAHVITTEYTGSLTVEEIVALAAKEQIPPSPPTGTSWSTCDPFAEVARGRFSSRVVKQGLLRTLASMVDGVAGGDGWRTIRVSSVPYHGAGADAADELALSLSTAVAYLRALTDGSGIGGVASIDRERAASQLWFQIAVGRDTFGEICKLRALRLLAAKLFAASGIAAAAPPIHAVSSSRTQAQRDPWVNMLRVTTEMFAAILGGARYVTPAPFDDAGSPRDVSAAEGRRGSIDDALGIPSAHARRVARNTALILRDESYLGHVIDAAGGSYYLESRTDALAREAWARFQQIERDGGMAELLASNALHERLTVSWKTRAVAIAKRKEPVLGVSEFANVDEILPTVEPFPSAPPTRPPHLGDALPRHRDAEGFEAVRAHVEAHPRQVALVPLGPPAEHRARVGYATAFFATAGLHTPELVVGDVPDIAVLCGSDERYATEAVAHAAELRAAGARKIVLAGRPGALEAELQRAGVDAFIFVGCDVLATLQELTR